MRTNRFSILLTITASLALHGLILSSFFFTGSNVMEPGFGIVGVEMTYSTARSQSAQGSAIQKKEGLSRQKNRAAELKDSLAKPAVGTTEVGTPERSSGNEAMVNGPRISKWPVVLREKKVAYPPEAKANSVQGVVTLRITIDEEGRPQNIEVLSGPGYGLNEAAQEALRSFVFSPAFLGDTAIPVRIIYKYRFQIE